MIKHYIQWLKGAQTSVSPFLVGDDDLCIQDNVVTSYKLGAILKRLGYKQVGGVLDAKPITGLHNFRQSKTVQKILATCNNATDTNLTLQWNDDGTWTDIALGGAWDGKEDSRVEMEDFIGYCFFVGYDSTDKKFLPVGSLTGTTYGFTNTSGSDAEFTAAITDIITSAGHGLSDNDIVQFTTTGTLPAGLSLNVSYYIINSATNTFKVSLTLGGSAVDITNTGTGIHTWTQITMPQGKFIKRYRDRLYVANLYDGGAISYRVGYSDIPSGTTLGWTAYEAGTGLFNVDYSEPITGLGSNWDKLFIFTEYSAYKYDQVTLKKAWDVGCIEHRTIKNLGPYMIWANRDGVWQGSSGRPMNIAGRILDFVKASIVLGNSMFAEVIDDEYHLYLGDVTVNGIAYSNCSVIYNMATQSWRTAEYHDNFTIFAKYNNSGDDRLYMGATDGEVMEMTKYYDRTPVYADDGNDISAHFETKQFDFGDPSIEKNIQKIIFYADKSVGLNMKAMIIDKNTRALNKIVDLGTLKGYITEAKFKSIKGNFIKFIGTESGKNPYFSFFGLTVLLEGNTKL